MSEQDELQAQGGFFCLRFQILTLMLLAASVSVWAWYFKLVFDNRQIIQQNEAMRAISRELVIEDVNRISIARQQPNWYDESIWQVYIPEGDTYQLHLATRKIDWQEADYKPPSVAQASLNSGIMKIQLLEDEIEQGTRVVVLVNEEEVLSQLETDELWNDSSGSTGGAKFDKPEQPTDKQTVVLFSRRFMLKSDRLGAPNDPANGIQLWLEMKE